LLVCYTLFVLWIVWTSVVLLRTPAGLLVETVPAARPAEVGA
jgi:hypothetical protein